MIAGSPKQALDGSLALPCRAYFDRECSSSGAFVLTRLITQRVLSGCLLLFAFVFCLLWSDGAVAAEETGGKEESPYVKVAPIMVNLHGLRQFLRITLTLKVANPLLLNTVRGNMPVILNELTYLLSDRRAEQFESTEDKMMLIQQAKRAINKALALDAKEGVSEVLLESWVID